jgi:hypothetical protein
MEAEIIQLANLLPESEVEFYLIIEECGTRVPDLEALQAIMADTIAEAASGVTARPATN